MEWAQVWTFLRLRHAPSLLVSQTAAGADSLSVHDLESEVISISKQSAVEACHDSFPSPIETLIGCNRCFLIFCILTLHSFILYTVGLRGVKNWLTKEANCAINCGIVCSIFCCDDIIVHCITWLCDGATQASEFIQNRLRIMGKFAILVFLQSSVK